MKNKQLRFSKNIRALLILLGIVSAGVSIVSCGKDNGFGVGGKVIITGGSR